MGKVERPCATVGMIFQYKTVNGDKRTDKGGKAVLLKQGERLFLLTVKQLATYSALGETDTITNVSIPLLKAVRGDRTLAYRNVIKAVDVPIWTQIDVSDEDPRIPINEDEGKSIDLRAHDSIYYLEVTNEAWAKSPQYQPVTSNTVNISLGDMVRFCSQRKMGTGFLAEFPQWRTIREVDGASTVYPGKGNEWYQMNSTFQVPPTSGKDCKGAQITFAFPSSILTDWCYYPPMFLIDVNVKPSSCGTPLVNEDNELVGILSDPAYLIEGSKDLVYPGTWVCAVPAGLTFPEPEGDASQETDQTPNQPKQNKPKKKGGKKKKKGKKK